MRTYKIFDLLQQLSLDEARQFHLFLQYAFPRSSQLHAGMDILLSVHPDYYQQDLSFLQNVFLTVFGNAPFDHKKLATFFSKLYKPLKEYLAVEQFRQDPFLQAYFLTQSARARRLDELYTETLTQGTQRNQAIPAHDWQSLMVLLQLFHVKYYNPLKTKNNPQHRDLFALKQAKTTLERLNHVLQLRYAVEYQNQQFLLSVSDTKDTQNTHLELDSIVLELYRLIQRQFENTTNNEGLLIIIAKYYDHFQVFDPENQFYLLQYIFNLCSASLRHKHTDSIYEKLFELIQFSSEHDLIDAFGGMTAVRFLNVIDIALSKEEVSWIESFINKHIEEIPLVEQEDVLHLALAHLNFGQKNFDEARRELQAIEKNSKDISFEIRKRFLECKIFYSEEAMELLDFKMDAFENYLRRQKHFKDPIIKGYLNFIKLLRTIKGHKWGEEKKLLNKIESTHPLAGKIWLENLLKKHSRS